MRDWRSVWTDIKGRDRGVIITKVSASGSCSIVTVAPVIARIWHTAGHLFADSIRGEDLGKAFIVCIKGVVVVELWEDEMGWGM